ncbi:dockerin type I repeat-containing protein [Candidatus Parcubacteria bacterium]|nr:dockerin type I repeat-containing protein [Candidatus Parcubacteria bacterium]
MIIGFCAQVVAVQPANAEDSSSVPLAAMAAQEIRAAIDRIVVQIQGLQKQLLEMETMKEGVISVDNSGKVWCHDFNINLMVGNKGKEVEDLLYALGKDGISVDRDVLCFGLVGSCPLFNATVRDAVIVFQEKYASEILTPVRLQRGTGFVGSSTRAKLNQLFSCSNVQPVGKQPPCANYGDVNMDGKVSKKDSDLILDASVGKVTLTDEQKTRGDVSADGEASPYDSSLILQYLEVIISTFSAVCTQ